MNDTYAIKGVPYVKCAEQSFMYYDMDVKNAVRYAELLLEFYPFKNTNRKRV